MKIKNSKHYSTHTIDLENSIDSKSQPQVLTKVKLLFLSIIRQFITFEFWSNRFPIVIWIKSYSLHNLKLDLIAGVTVGLTVIPQAFAYSMLAGLSAKFGLYSAYICVFLYAIMGTSRDCALGPTAINALLINIFLTTHPDTHHSMAATMSFFVGLVQILMAIVQFGFITKFVSYPIINGFTVAASIIIGMSQAKNLLGIKNISKRLIFMIPDIIYKIKDTNLYDFALGISCIILLLIFRYIKNRHIINNPPKAFPNYKKRFYKFVWFICTEPHLPNFTIPDFTVEVDGVQRNVQYILSSFGLGLYIIPFITTLETIAIGKTFARKHGYKINPNQEILTMGVANLIGSFYKAFPIAGSISRSAVLSATHGQTPMSNVYTGVIVILALEYLTPLCYYIPNSALSAVVIVAVIDMFCFRVILNIVKVSPIDAIPWMSTFLFSIFFGIEYGLVIGILLALIILLYPYAFPKMQIVENIRQYIQIGIDDYVLDQIELVILYRPFMYPCADSFKDYMCYEVGNKTVKNKQTLPQVTEEENLLDKNEEKVDVTVKMCKNNKYINRVKKCINSLKFNNEKELNDKRVSYIICCMHRVPRTDYTFVEELREISEFYEEKEIVLYVISKKRSVINVLSKSNLQNLLLFRTIEDAIVDVKFKIDAKISKKFSSEYDENFFKSKCQSTSMHLNKRGNGFFYVENGTEKHRHQSEGKINRDHIGLKTINDAFNRSLSTHSPSSKTKSISETKSSIEIESDDEIDEAKDDYDHKYL
ncbi:Anion exchange transporter [Intoshia linei]|uniref:Anion exchange transporter n=1 Tax=Intoshia linei TaxID=1819745 RepID=A0A177B2A3_9BILA|nr:Anion exchange transporter [Intoshia linei]